MIKTIGMMNSICGLICAKWAMDLGINQTRQIIFLIGGLIFGPLMLLILYVRLLYKAKKEDAPEAKIV